MNTPKKRLKILIRLTNTVARVLRNKTQTSKACYESYIFALTLIVGFLFVKTHETAAFR